MKLNPEKYVFGVSSGKFLEFLVYNRGIEVNPAQIKAIEEIPDIITSTKEDQFEWSEECQQALKNLKVYLSNPPLLAKLKDGEKLLIYLAVLEIAVLADFMADFSQGMQPEVEKELQVFNRSNPGIWTLFIDGSSNIKGAGLGIFLVRPTGETIRQAIKCHPITNNEAEYEDVIAGLELARELGVEQVVIKSDSQLVVNQMLGTYTTREARMQQYLEKARDLVRQFQTGKVVQIPREENVEADALSNLASATDVTNDENTSVIHLFHSVLDQDKNEVTFNYLNWDWRNEIVTFLQYGIVPEDKKKAHALCKKVARYCLKQSKFYRKVFGGTLARCLRPSQTDYVMREIHEGHCGNHAGGRPLVKTMIRAGYYWPKMEEAENFVAKCDKYQRYSNNMHRPAELLHLIIALWPFMK
ncbi:uncharacterized protein [Nicotiana sylvestris]|uniref:uncharacterized protein n=1 Tax=Nicotiana sylvestris TaxID=4096 RepID=UPI00388C8D80